MAANLKITLLALLLTSSAIVFADPPSSPDVTLDTNSERTSIAADMKCRESQTPQFHIMKADTFDYSSRRPSDLISFLKDTEFHDYVPSKMPKNWVKGSDISALIRLIDSKEESARLRSPYSSFINPCRSTVGQEAARLISIFRGNTQTKMSDEFDTNEIKKWYTSSHNQILENTPH